VLFRRNPDEPRPPTAWRLGFASGVAALASLLVLIAYLISMWVAVAAGRVEAPRTLGAPLRVAAPGVDGVFLLTAQQETRVTGGRSRWSAHRGTETVTHVDLWRFDVSSMQPVWRRRLLTERGGSIGDLALMGADGARLWVFLRQPLVLDLASGDVIGNASVIEARNTPLQGVLPRQLNHYRFFEGYGLVFTAADARAWVLDAGTFVATPWQAKGTPRRPATIGPAYLAPNSLTTFQKRGLLLPRDWLGVLTDDEAAALSKPPEVPGAKPGERRGALAAHLEYMQAPPDLAHAGPKRYRLWRSKVEQVSAAPAGWPKELPNNWGLRPRYSNFRVLEQSPEFLQAGLLGDGRSKVPIWLTGPDSVLVAHRDRIDAEGRLHVTRIAGPAGRVVWDAPLQLSILQSVMVGTGPLLLFGRGHVQPLPQVGDPYHSAHEWLVSLDLASGAVRSFDMTAVDADKRE